MAFVIPSVFTAVNKFSPTVMKMGNDLEGFIAKAENGVARSERAFRKLTPALSNMSKDILTAFGAVAIGQKILQGIEFSAKSIMDYETELANLRAVTGVSGKDFDVFKIKIQEVAIATKKSAVEVSQAFTAIANNQPALLKDANALAAVTQSSILLAQASKMELQPAGEALTQILNQFQKGAMDAAKTVDILAAGSVAGSSEIRDTAAAIQQFGTVAANAGVKINESVALIELASKFEKGAEAGTRLRNILLVMSTIKVQDPKALKDLHRLGVNMKVVSDSTLPLADRLKEISKISKDNAALFHVFGKENQALATGILSTADSFTTMLDAVNTQGMASKMATENNNTLSVALDQLKAAWVNMLTNSDKATSGLNTARTAVQFLAEHLDTIVSVGTKVILFFVAWKAWILLTKVALVGLRVVSGALFLVDMVKYIATTQGLTFAQAAWAIIVSSCTSAMATLNAVMLANPIGLIILAIAAMVAIVVVVIKYWNQWGAAVSMLLGPLGFVISLIQSFRRNWDMIKESFKSGGILQGFMAIGKVILDAILMPMQQVMKLIASITGFQWAKNAESNLDKFRANLGVNTTTDEGGNAIVNPKEAEQNALVQKMEQTNHAKVDINVKDPNGRTTAESNNNFVNIQTSSTMVWGM